MSPALRRSGWSLTALATTATFLLVAPAAPVPAAPLPATYTASAHGDLVYVGADLGILGSLAQVPVGHSHADVDSSRGSNDVTAEAANVDADLLGSLPITVDNIGAAAAPDAPSTGQDLLAVPLAPIAAATVVHGQVEAHYTDDTSCPTLAGGARLLGKAEASAAGVTLVDILGLGSVAQVGAVDSVSETALVPDGTGGDDVVSKVTTTVGDIALLGGLVTIHVSDAVVTTAASDGTTGTASRSNYTVVVSVGGSEAASIPSTSTSPVSIPVDLGIIGTSVNLSVGVGTFTDSSAAANGAGSQDAVVGVGLQVTAAAINVADIELAVGAGDVAATAPDGGVECTPVAPVDTDGDGLSDADEATYGTDPLDPDTDDGGATDGAEIDNGTDPVDDPADDLPSTDGDGDGLTDAEEAAHQTDPADADSDDDGLSDGAEVNTTGTDPNVADTDGGGVNDGAEVANGTNPVDDPADDVATTDDADGDGLSDADEATAGTDPDDSDSDNDGLSDGAEVHTHGTDPLDPDTDDGGVTDGAEVANGTNPVDAPADDVPSNDRDGDGLTNDEELTHGTDPDDADSDDDGLTDTRELNGPTGCTTGHTNPLRKDTDGDGLVDGPEVKGINIKQVVFTNRGKPVNGRSIGIVRTNPCAKDTDRDGLSDRQEVVGTKINQRVKRTKKLGGWYLLTTRRSNPVKKDTDGDGLGDKAEVTGSANWRHGKHRSDPTRADTDWGGATDGREIRIKADPTWAA